MIFIIYRYNYKQFIKDNLIHHLFFIDGGLLTIYDEINSDPVGVDQNTWKIAANSRYPL